MERVVKEYIYKVMKTILILILASVINLNSFAVNNETDDLKEIKQSISRQNRQISSLEKANDELEESVDYLSVKQDGNAKNIDSLKSEIGKLAEKDNSIEGGLTDANKKIDYNAKASDDKISNRTAWGIGAGIVLLVVALLVYLILFSAPCGRLWSICSWDSYIPKPDKPDWPLCLTPKSYKSLPDDTRLPQYARSSDNH